MELTFTLNGQRRSFEITPGDLLVDVLRANRLFGTRRGCETGDCGACTVLLDGVPTASCVLLAAKANGRAVTTIEGVGVVSGLAEIVECFRDTPATQCGFCTPGMVLTAKYILDQCDNQPDPIEIERLLSGLMCRCTGVQKCVEAILAAGRRLKG